MPSGEKEYFISAVGVHTRQAWFDAYTFLSAANSTDMLRYIYKDFKPEQMQVD